MKLVNDPRQEVELIGEFGQQEAFKIEASAMAFKILSSGLYSDPIRAVIRELSTNAYDAHLEAGKGEKPFRVHLPTRFEPWFAVSDEGVGMDHQRVLKNYTTYFGSTKQETNDLVGCLGLGSKSPFALTDTFTIESTKDGVKRTYTALINQKGFPHVMLVSEDPTEAPNGVTVIMPVKTHEVGDFHQKARQVYKDFPVCPEFNTIQGGPLGKIEYSVQGKDWGLRKANQDVGYYTKARVIQGCVAYPLDASQLGFEHPLLNSNMDLFVPIGSVEITPSRESLNYTDMTKRNLKSYLDEVIEGLADTYSTQFEACTNKVQALLLMNKLRKDGNELFKVVSESLMKRQYTHYKLTHDFIALDQMEYPSVGLCQVQFGYRTILEDVFETREYRRKITSGEETWSKNYWKKQEVKINLVQEPMFVYNDLPKCGFGFQTLLARAEDGGEFKQKQMMAIVPGKFRVETGKTKAGDPVWGWDQDEGARDQAELLAMEFDTTLTLASELIQKYPAPERAKRAYTGPQIRRFVQGAERWILGDGNEDWEALEGETKLYVRVKARQAQPMELVTTDEQGDEVHGEWHVDNIQHIREQLISLGIIDRQDPIFGVPDKLLKGVQEDPEFVLLSDWVSEWLKKLPTELEGKLIAYQNLAVLNRLQQYTDLCDHKLVKGTWLDGLLGPNVGYIKASQNLEYWGEDKKLVDTAKEYLKRFGVAEPKKDLGHLKDLSDQILKKYPMINDFEGTNRKAKYIGMVEEMDALRAKVQSLETELQEARDKNSLVA